MRGATVAKAGGDDGFLEESGAAVVVVAHE